ncbi:hypothetical protein [Mesorhizobium sp. M1403]|uniref:hypothetical protein n=1 Tax=Mesorhizobium sp. M1403 TaxID=2957097 RepID=UPI00333BC347
MDDNLAIIALTDRRAAIAKREHLLDQAEGAPSSSGAPEALRERDPSRLRPGVAAETSAML